MYLSLPGLLVLLALLAPTTPRESVPTLRVSPLVGLAPLTVVAVTRLVVPLETDRTLDLSLVEGDDIVLRRSVRDIFWQPTIHAAAYAVYRRRFPATHNLQPGIGHMYQAVPQSHRVTWELPPGVYRVVACVWPGGRCVAQDVLVR